MYVCNRSVYARHRSLVARLATSPLLPLRVQSDKAPFQRPFGDQAAADAARQRFAQHKSDHLAIVEAFGAWRNKVRGGCFSCVVQS